MNSFKLIGNSILLGGESHPFKFLNEINSNTNLIYSRLASVKQEKLETGCYVIGSSNFGKIIIPGSQKILTNNGSKFPYQIEPGIDQTKMIFYNHNRYSTHFKSHLNKILKKEYKSSINENDLSEFFNKYIKEIVGLCDKDVIETVVGLTKRVFGKTKIALKEDCIVRAIQSLYTKLNKDTEIQFNKGFTILKINESKEIITSVNSCKSIINEIRYLESKRSKIYTLKSKDWLIPLYGFVLIASDSSFQ